jgi:hypothetical protein
MCTRLNQRHGARQTDTTAAARDPGHLALKLFAHAASSLLLNDGAFNHACVWDGVTFYRRADLVHRQSAGMLFLNLIDKNTNYI